MNASVINRFAKNVAMARTGWTRRGHRLAMTVPLAAVMAVGAVACDNPDATKAAGAAASAVASAAPSTTAPATSSATPSDAPTTAAAKAAARKGFSVRINGLDGAKAEAGGKSVAFSVTWTNDTDRSYDGIRPVVATKDFDGARCSFIMPMAAGKLERKDNGSWTDLPSLSQGTGMDYATTGDKARFDLAPGASRTIEYRMTLAADNGPGTLPVEAAAYIGKNYEQLGKSTVTNVQLVDPHRPAASLLKALPASVTAGGEGLVVETQVYNASSAPFKAVAPEVALLDVQVNKYEVRSVIDQKDIKAEVFWKGAWQQVPTKQTCSGETQGFVADTSAMNQELAAGHGQRLMFRFSLAKTASADLKALTVAVGAHADGHYSALTFQQLDVRR